jgi:hypothetical protein
MLSATRNSPMLAILAVAIVLATPAITESALASKSISLSTQSPFLNTIFKQVENSVVQITSNQYQYSKFEDYACCTTLTILVSLAFAYLPSHLHNAAFVIPIVGSQKSACDFFITIRLHRKV